MAQNETLWTLKTGETLVYTVTNSPTYSFRFTGFGYQEPIYNEFQMWVWRKRKEAGFDEPMPEPIGYKEPDWQSNTGTLLYTGKLVVNSPAYTSQIYGFTS